MDKHDQQPRLAVLIDVENTQLAVVQALLAEAAKYGIASVKRGYGDWTSGRLGGWKTVLNEHAIQPVQQFRYTTGKNSSDSALIIDAMDLLYTGRLHGFCIVSSDSDFTRLATRLRESGMRVYGFGEKKTPRAFVSACDRFIYTEILAGEEENGGAANAPSASKKKSTLELRGDAKLVNMLRTAADSQADEDGWVNVSRFAAQIAKRAPDFDPRNYGYRKLTQLIIATELFEIDERKTKSGHGQKFIRDSRTKRPLQRSLFAPQNGAP